MSDVFMILSMLGFCAFPILLVTLIIQGIRKRVDKSVVVALIVAFCMFVVFLSLELVTSCDHEWNTEVCTEERVCATCGEVRAPKEHDWENDICTEPRTCRDCEFQESEAVGHDWAEATCTDARHCTRCNEVSGEALGHQYGAWETISEPTCTAEGTQQRTCSGCGTTEEKTLTATGHTRGEWTVTEQATEEKPGRREIACTVCGAVLETEEFTEDPAVVEARYKEACTAYTYEEIARNPEAYVGELATFTGEVIQVLRFDTSGAISYELRVDVTYTGYYYTDTIYVTYEAPAGAPRILEGDIVRLYGELQEEETYLSIFGSLITLPALEAEYIEISSAAS